MTVHPLQYRVLATDYDGTLACEGGVTSSTCLALERLRNAGRLLLLVTGREVEDLEAIFSKLDLFHLVVAENGAVLYDPHTGEIKSLAAPQPMSLALKLQARGVSPLTIGHVIIGTLIDQRTLVEDALQELDLEANLIPNKESLMLLPQGVDKASGLKAALSQLEIAPAQCVGVGDAENDLPFLRACGCGVAVSNAIPIVQDAADFVTEKPYGEGVVELIEVLVEGRDAELMPDRRP